VESPLSRILDYLLAYCTGLLLYFSHNTHLLGYKNNGAQWASQAQGRALDLFDLAWGLRNEAEHGVDLETQRKIRLAKCERAIRHLFHGSVPLPSYDRYPFHESMEDVLSKAVTVQERWVGMAGAFIPVALRRLRKETKTGQRSLKSNFVFGDPLLDFCSELVGILGHDGVGLAIQELPSHLDSRRKTESMMSARYIEVVANVFVPNAIVFDAVH
jgi:hypothetical protein